MMKVFIILGALNAMMAVGTGAFGAHGLEGKLSDKYMSIWEKATIYQMYHGLGLLVIGLISGTTSMNVNWAGWLLFFGLFQWFLVFLSLNTSSYFRCNYANRWCSIYNWLACSCNCYT